MSLVNSELASSNQSHISQNLRVTEYILLLINVCILCVCVYILYILIVLKLKLGFYFTNNYGVQFFQSIIGNIFAFM